MTPDPPKGVRTPTRDPEDAGTRSLPYLGEPDAATKVLMRGTQGQKEGDVKWEVEAGMTCPKRGCDGHERLEKANERIRPSTPLEGASSPTP